MQNKTPPTQITAFYLVDGIPDEVTVVSTGRGPSDYGNLYAAIQKKYPKVPRSRIVRTGSVISLQNGGEAPRIDLNSGKTLRQLFDTAAANGEPRTSLNLGKVFFNGTPCSVMLTFNRAASFIGVLLLPRIKSDGPIKFSNQLSPQMAVSELPRLVRDVLGRDALALELNIKTAPATAAAPAKPLPVAPAKKNPATKPKPLA